jgi:hypothetical protein
VFRLYEFKHKAALLAFPAQDWTTMFYATTRAGGAEIGQPLPILRQARDDTRNPTLTLFERKTNFVFNERPGS